ncbi:MAG: methyltransferase domain-containing protein [Bacteroidota bacterium]
MAEKAAFDGIAAQYDADFTHSAVGQMQRQQVHAYLENFLTEKGKCRILELNCGTGEDARWLAERGHAVSATDLSPEMIRVATTKQSPGHQLEFRTQDILGSLRAATGKYDLVFSNFGGFNCLSPEELAEAGRLLGRALAQGGHFIGVVMARTCLWESFYFGFKRDRKQAFRRRKGGPLEVKLDTAHTQLTWYYHPRHLRRAFSPRLDQDHQRPIGFFLPPSYLDPYFQKHPQRLARLQRMEMRVAGWPFLARYSDHYLVDFSLLNAPS